MEAPIDRRTPTINRKKSRFASFRFRSIAAIAILLALNSSILSADAATSWIEVHPPAIEEAGGVETIHFIDADNGYAEGSGGMIPWLEKWAGLRLRTRDGGWSWRQEEPVDDRISSTDFISPTTGWRLGEQPPDGSEPPMLADLEFYHSTDGGLTWQFQQGIVTELIDISDLQNPPDFPQGRLRRYRDTHIYFLDEHSGWLLGHTHGWKDRAAGRAYTANYIYSTRDGGQTWRCHVDVYTTGADPGRSPVIDHGSRSPVDIDFGDSRVGWIGAAPSPYYFTDDKWIYRTVDGGTTWEWLGHPRLAGQVKSIYIEAIDVVDSHRGWVIGNGVWFTRDGGDTWTQKLSGYYTAIHADVNEAWVVGITWLPIGGRQSQILHSVDDGNSWQVEWQDSPLIRYIGYHEVTQTLWAGGEDGVILRRTIPATNATPIVKPAMLWGKLKAGANTHQ